jgi:hypothetical protein
MEHTELPFNRIIEIEKEVNQLPKGVSPALLSQLAEIARRPINENIPGHLDSDVERATREGLRDIVGHD